MYIKGKWSVMLKMLEGMMGLITFGKLTFVKANHMERYNIILLSSPHEYNSEEGSLAIRLLESFLKFYSSGE